MRICFLGLAMSHQCTLSYSTKKLLVWSFCRGWKTFTHGGVGLIWGCQGLQYRCGTLFIGKIHSCHCEKIQVHAPLLVPTGNKHFHHIGKKYGYRPITSNNHVFPLSPWSTTKPFSSIFCQTLWFWSPRFWTGPFAPPNFLFWRYA